MKNSLRSVALSRVITIILLAVVILCFLLLPFIMRAYFHYRQMPSNIFTPLLVLCYCCALCAIGVLLKLWVLLSRIGKGIFFDQKNISLLRDLSVFCIAIGALTAIGTVWYFPCIIIAIAAGFLFLILRVLQTVFSAAADLKNENDMTI